MHAQQAVLDATAAAPNTAPSGSGTGAPAGPRLGPFVILAELGKGGMGAVYRARDTNLDREVALKVLLPALAADPRAVARFLREARAQAKVEHDHIVPIHDASETDGVAYLVMPLLKGQSLGAALKQNRHPPLAEAVRIGREIAEGLSAAHAAGLIHRDIKPGNVWLEGAARRVKILDFGLARTAEAGADEPDAPVSARTAVGGDLTEQGAVVGTPAYMSPEQAHGRKVDARTDLFALGVVLYEMTTGRKPFTGASPLEILAAVSDFDPPAARELNADVPAELSELIRALMAKDPAARPATAAEVVRALEYVARAVAGLPVVVVPVGGVPGEPSPWDDIDATEAAATEAAAPVVVPARDRERKSLWWAAGAVVLVALVVGGVVAARNREKKPPEPPVAIVPMVPKPPTQPPKQAVPSKPTEPLAVPLFTNELSGWKSLPPNHWRMENGELVGTFPEGVTPDDAHLRSVAQYSDYELAFAVRLTKGNGRGRHAHAEVFLRDQPGGKNAGGLRCVLGSDDWGGLRQNAANTTTKPAAAALATVKPTDFNDVVIRCVGQQFRVTLNGVVAVDERRDKMHATGALVWRFTSGTAELRVRDIRITDLTAAK